jgi:hypothetical protein
MSRKESPELRIVAILLWRLEHFGEPGTEAAAEAIKARDEQRMERFRDALGMIFRRTDEISFRINGGCIEAKIEGLRFVSLEFPARGNHVPSTAVTLLGRCSSCGAEVMSETIHSLSELGKMLEKFEPIRWHACYGAQ